MHVYVYSLNKVLYEGETSSITLPTETGEITVLPGHISLVTSLSKGKIRIKNSHEQKEVDIIGGVGQISDKKVILLVNN